MNKPEITAEVDLTRIDAIVTEYSQQKWALIPLLQKIQNDFGYIPPQSIPIIARALELFPSQVQGVASFYTQFRFIQPAEHAVKVCLGTACHVRGGARILAEVEKQIGIKVGETSEDYKFSLERVACFGCCALSPVMVVDGVVHSKMTPVKARELVSSYQ
jgi:NADH:ubiquinone oxidoreductase subunit E